MKGARKTWPEQFFAMAFERYEDAERYANLASAPDFALTPVQWHPEQLRTFCHIENFEVAFAQQFVIPPSASDQFDYDMYGKVVRGKESRSPDRHESYDHSRNAYSPHGMSNGPRSSGPNEVFDSTMGKSLQPNMEHQGVSKIWVVMINPGRPNEGVYTLQSLEKQDQQSILAFETRDDAKGFGDKLKGFDIVAPMQWDSLHLRDFCEHGGYETSLISEGTSINPPDVNEYDAETYSKSGDASTLVADEEQLPLHRRLHLQNLRALLEDRLHKSKSEDDDIEPGRFQA
jgi:hypothetical protein